MRHLCTAHGLAALVFVSLLPALPADSGAQYFGKNKVQYENFDWKVLETEHFHVYYYEAEAEAARNAARMAERSYARLSHVLRHNFTRPIPLILYASHSQFQQTNILQDLIDEGTGGVTEFLKQRVFLPFTGSYAELEHVLSHELVHAFQVDILWGRDQNFLSNPFTFQPPLWFMEGMAEYLSLGGVDPNTEMWLKDGALHGYLVPISVLDYVYDIRVYRFGQSFWEFVARRYGEEKVGDILRRAATGRNVPRAFEHVLGLTLEKLSDDWTESIRVNYLPQVARHQRASDFGRRLTEHEKNQSNFNVAPALSPTGDKVVFVSDRGLATGLYLSSAIDGRDLGRLVEGERRADFESFRFFTSSADWHPDGRHLVFPAKAGGRDVLYVFDTHRKKRVRTLKFPSLDAITSPTWSPDGLQIVFSGEAGGQSDLYLCESDGSGLVRLTNDGHADKQPRFSPDGTRLAFITDRGEGTDFERLVFARYRVAVFDLATRAIRELPGMDGKNISPHWSADGREIVFVSDRTGINNLFVLTLDTGEVRRISNLLAGVSGITEGSPPLTVSKDGRRLVFSSFEKGGWDLVAVKDPFQLPALPPIPDADAVLAGASVATPVPGSAFLVEPPVRGEPGGLGRVALSVPARTALLPDSTLDLLLPPGGGRRPQDATRPGDPREGMSRPPLPEPEARPDAPAGPNTESAEVVAGAGADSTTVASAAVAGAPPDSARGVAPVVPDSLARALDALPDTLKFERRRYRPTFSTDYAATQASFGTDYGLAGLAVLSFSDMLGDRSIVAAAGIYGSLLESDILLQYVDQSRRNSYGVALYQYRNDYFLVSRPFEDEYETEINRGAEVFVSRPFDKFHRMELSLSAVAVKERRIVTNYEDDEEVLFERPTSFYAGPGLAWVKDTALYGSTGPIGGTRARLSVDQALGGIERTNLLFDYRSYHAFARRYSFSWRVLAANSAGKDPLIYRIGGPFTTRSVDYGDIEGSRVALANFELRVPFIDRLSTSFPLAVDWPGIRGALFFDLGAGWGLRTDGLKAPFKPFSSEEGFHLRDLTAAFGFGVRSNLGFLILRYDVAQPTNLQENLGSARHFFSLGADF
jgi:Tol biopolymer transport system component